MSDLDEFLAKATLRGTAATARVLRLDELAKEHRAPDIEAWGLGAMRGRLVEVSACGATATMTTAAELVLEAQRADEPVAWVVPWSPEPNTSTFFPPDIADAGIDLSALVVVRAPSALAATRAAERLLRSGAFGLIVLDFGDIDFEANSLSRSPDQVLGRLVTLAQAHDTAVVCLTNKTPESASLGSLVSLRAEAMRLRQPPPDDGFDVTLRALKDKRRGPGWSRRSKARGPTGL